MDLEVILAEEVESHLNTSEKLESHRRKDHCKLNENPLWLRGFVAN